MKNSYWYIFIFLDWYSHWRWSGFLCGDPQLHGRTIRQTRRRRQSTIGQKSTCPSFGILPFPHEHSRTAQGRPSWSKNVRVHAVGESYNDNVMSFPKINRNKMATDFSTTRQLFGKQWRIFFFQNCYLSFGDVNLLRSSYPPRHTLQNVYNVNKCFYQFHVFFRTSKFWSPILIHLIRDERSW